MDHNHTSETTPEVEQQLCNNCMAVVFSGGRYCGNCGHYQVWDAMPETSYRVSQLKKVGLFFSLHLLVCCLAHYVEYFDTLEWMAVFDIVLATINVTFVALNWPYVKPYLKWPGFSIQKLSLYVGIAMLLSLFTQYTINWINATVFDKYEYYYFAFAHLKYSKIAMVLSLAVVPALSEELGFRAYLINGLLKIVDARQAIIISSFLFSIVHLSFLSLYWLLPFSMFITYIFLKEKTMWYGVLFHFAFNLTACLFEIDELSL